MSASAERGERTRTSFARSLGLAIAFSLVLAACAKSDEQWLGELADPDPFVRAMAALALCEQAPERADAVVPILLETVDRAELGMQPQARSALVRIAPRASDLLRKTLAADKFMTIERRQAIEAALEAAAR